MMNDLWGGTSLLPDFETSRLFLRERTIADIEACLAMDRDPEVTKYVPGPWNDPKEHRHFLTGRIQAEFGPGLGYWSIFAKEQPDLFLGWVLLIPSDAIGPEIEIGWRLNRQARGNGFATEAARPIVVHAFKTVGVYRIIANIHPENTASMRVSEKIGLRVTDDECLYNGLPCKAYAMTQDDFIATS